MATTAGLSIVPTLPFLLDHPVEEVVHWFMSQAWPLKPGQVDVYESHVHSNIAQHQSQQIEAKPEGLLTSRF